MSDTSPPVAPDEPAPVMPTVPTATATVLDGSRHDLVRGGLRNGLPPSIALSNAQAWMAWIDAGTDAACIAAREGLAVVSCNTYPTCLYDGEYAADLADCAAWCVVAAPAA